MAGDDAIMSGDQASFLLGMAGEQLDLPENGNTDDRHCPVPGTCTFGQVRAQIRQLVEGLGKQFNEFLAEFADKAGDDYERCSLFAKKVKDSLVKYRRENLLPDEHTLEKVTRYEAHLSRQFHRDLHELQRLQAMRHGLSVTVPVAIDVDVAGPANGKRAAGQ